MSRLLRACLGYVVLIALVSALYPRPLVLLATVLALSALVLALLRSRVSSLAWLVGALLGPIGESFAVWRGAWSYWGELAIPIWLAPAWGLASLLFMEIAGGLATLTRSGSGPADPPGT